MNLFDDPVRLFSIGAGLLLFGISSVAGQSLANRLRIRLVKTPLDHFARAKSIQAYGIGLWIWLALGIGFIFSSPTIGLAAVSGTLAIYLPSLWVLYWARTANHG